MRRRKHIHWLVPAFFCLALALRGADILDPRLRFNVTLDRGLGTNPVSGRLLVLMTTRREPVQVIEPSVANAKDLWVCAREVEGLKPGDSVEVDPDVLAFPQPLSHAPDGGYQVMALLDTDHSLGYSGVGGGDLFGPVTRFGELAPREAGTIRLQLTTRVPDEEPVRETPTRKLAKMQSALLTAFWGRPIEMRAGVVLPPSYAASPDRRYPTVYYIHGFGESHRAAFRDDRNCCGPAPKQMETAMAAGKWPEMIYVFLDATCPLGHHAFVDSVNNGPWGRALVEEFIPHLERTYRMEARPESRFLNGHSSGGWAVLWAQATRPDFFGGAWATSPDPVDFRNWTGPDLTKSPPENMYRKTGSRPRWLIRMDGREVLTVEDFARFERLLGDHDGQFSSFEAVFSPRGDDGRPLPLFNRDTGAIDPQVQKAWQAYDLSRLLRTNWERLGPKLKGRLHITVGTQDTIHLEESVHLLSDTLKALGSDAEFTFLEGRTHFNVYADDLAQHMAWAMYQVAHPKDPPDRKP